MFGHKFYYEGLSKAVTIFGNLFNDIYISREDKDGNTVDYQKIPLTYGPQEKFLARLRQDPNLDRQPAILLPRIGFEMSDITYDPTRKLATLHKTSSEINEDKTRKVYQYMGVPYNINFNLVIASKTAEDANKILEQIVPFFTPAWVTKAHINDPFAIPYDIPVTLVSITYSDTYNDALTERRMVTYSLAFKMQTMFFGPTPKTKVIKTTNINFIVPDRINTFTGVDLSQYQDVETITIKPGLTANGEPTSNAELTVALSEIDGNTNFGYIITQTSVDTA